MTALTSLATGANPVTLDALPRNLRFGGALLQNAVHSFRDLPASLRLLAQALMPRSPVLVNHIHSGSTASSHERVVRTPSRGNRRYGGGQLLRHR